MKESSNAALDRTDLKIMRLLQTNGRMSNAEIAERVNVSAATCHRRIQRLFDEGYIKGVRAELDPARIGLGAVVLVGVVLDRSTPDSFAAFEAAVRELDMVLSCHLVAGEFDYLMKLRVRDIESFNRLHGSSIIALPGVRQTRTFFVLKEVTDNAPLSF